MPLISKKQKIIVVCMCIALSTILSSGCYYIKQGSSLLSNQMRAKKIKNWGTDSTLSEKERALFNAIDSIRAYAFDILGLKKNANYTRYVRIDHTYLVAVLSVADSASLTPYTWCYPFLGCFPLRGYHDSVDAQKAGKRFADKGYEINIDKVNAFSTLGIFSDPVYSFMKEYPVFSLARLIFHEQTHATAFFKNVQFSEELATFIGNEGALEYIKVRYGDESVEYCNALDYLEDNKTWIRMLRNLYNKLDSLYHTDISREEKILEKKKNIAALKHTIKTCYDSLFITDLYRDVVDLSLNNAFLAVRMTYSLDLELFAELRRTKGSLRDVVTYAKELKKRKGDPKKLLIADLKKDQQ